MSEYRMSEGMMGMMPYYCYPPEFPSSLSPSSALEDAKPRLGSDLVHPSHYMASPLPPYFGRGEQLDHRIAYPQYPRHLPPGDHYRAYSSELTGPSSAELRGRAENWTYEETRTFVRLLMEHAAEFQNIRRHPGLWSMLANRMVQHGFPRTVEKCKNRWKVLVAKYKRCHSEMQRQQSSKFSSTDKNTLLLHDGASPSAQASQGFEFFYQMETLLKPNYHIGADGVQRRFRSADQKRTSPPALESYVEPSTPITPSANYYSQYSLPQYPPLMPATPAPHSYYSHY